MPANAPSFRPISDPDKLLAYAAWYYGRYAPAFSKLRKKLEAKAASPELAESVLARFSELADDRRNLESRVAGAVSTGKSLSKLKGKWAAKGFSKADIEAAIGNDGNAGDWNVRKSAVLKRMKTFESRGKSRNAVFSALSIEFPEFRDHLKDSLDESYPPDAEIIAEFHVPPDLPSLAANDRKRIFDRLVRAGFRYRDLEAAFSGFGE